MMRFLAFAASFYLMALFVMLTTGLVGLAFGPYWMLPALPVAFAIGIYGEIHAIARFWPEVLS